MGGTGLVVQRGHSIGRNVPDCARLLVESGKGPDHPGAPRRRASVALEDVELDPTVLVEGR